MDKRKAAAARDFVASGVLDDAINELQARVMADLLNPVPTTNENIDSARLEIRALQDLRGKLRSYGGHADDGQHDGTSTSGPGVEGQGQG